MSSNARRPIDPDWSAGPLVGARGEFGVIASLRESLGEVTTPGLLLEVGDDAAILRPPADHDLIWTCDIQVEGRHFRRDWMTPEETGTRAAEVSISDVAAMGGAPLAVLVSLGLPADFHLGALEAIYRGMKAALEPHGARIVGGNITGAQEFSVDLSVLGCVPRGKALRRGSAQVGDQVYATGQPGRAAAALALFADDEIPGLAPEHRQTILGAYRHPRAQIEAGRYLRENECASAVIDQSDGLPGDLLHIAEESGVGIELLAESLPISPDLAALGGLKGVDPLRWIVGPSDDYGLLFTAPREAADRVLCLEQLAAGPSVHPIGRVVTGPPRVLLRDAHGHVLELSDGWDHLS